MAPLPDVAGVIKTQFIWTWDEDVDVMCRLFWHYSGHPAGQADLNDWTSDVFTDMGTFTASIMCSNVHLTQVKSTALDSNTAPESIATGSVAGTHTPPSVPAGTAMVLSLLNGVRYRGGHPRIYLPGIAINQLSDAQTWTSGALSGVETAFGTFTSSVSSHTFTTISGATLTTVSYYHGHTNVLYPSGYYRAVPTARSTPLVADVIGVRANPHVGSQRRRTLQSA